MADFLGSVDGPDRRMTRRSFLHTSAAAIIGCAGSPANPNVVGGVRLKARPHAPSRHLAPGAHDLPASIGTSAALFVPKGYSPEQPAPLFIMLHGAGASRDRIPLFFPHAEPFGLLMLAPKSLGRTWDMLIGGFGPDVAALDKALEYAFSNSAIDPSRIILGGFSDGGSYALSLGLANGDLFSRLVGFSPGFMIPPQRTGKPTIYLAHGTRDAVLPIDSTSRVIERQLRDWQYDVRYREFDGPHTVSLEIALEAFAWVKGDA